ncbi:MAG: zinc metallopeptidase [Bacteroidales bacterium]|nr:zinc metallopeptidase [Bacteroidales bacterium]
MTIWIIFIGLTLLSMVASKNVERKFKQYSKTPTEGGLTGREVAERMLYDNDIHNVTVQMVKGTLTDHYNPTNRTLNLSPDVYNGRSVAAASVAAHECGHAVQHATAYSWLRLRSTLVPVVSFSNRIVSWVLLGGLLLIKVFPALMLLGIMLFALSALFSLITLPVEIDASRRALAWVERAGVTTAATQPYAKSALRSAAYTYVIAAITALATLAYYVMIYLDRR